MIRDEEEVEVEVEVEARTKPYTPQKPVGDVHLLLIQYRFATFSHNTCKFANTLDL